MALGGVRPHRTRGVFTPHGICGLAGITRVGEGLGSETRCCPFHWLAPILANPDELVAIYAPLVSSSLGFATHFHFLPDSHALRIRWPFTHPLNLLYF